ncbi:uncharacterized protein BCR38DRAFT_338665 [Pseudomassariella vexata]|uniref:Heterokaryon incompatibility domain-containing protein n=1 Tax=Pseudomassariella vexata TaxID=1141098 RepID=A0A1Y2E516_9PEZI|nr:uncharacterized protein BCR38DRAFT_338665 [Pseudomassariella vexata]ORY66527.1 hypothetical protein BCR38DRAFT_338665 [Pseudomassariella vexata]
MYHVYKNACVTLGGLWGESSRSGLFSDTTDWAPKLVANLTSGSYGWPLFTQRIDRHPEFLNFQYTDNWFQPPLSRRAWTYQERIVSLRLLLFGKTELVFICFQRAFCQCGVTDNSEEFNSKKFFDTVITRDNCRINSRDEERESAAAEEAVNHSKNQESTWRVIVTEYSELQLTKQSDRLAGIGALAEQFQAARPDNNYLAGLWSGSIFRDLL